MPEKWYYIIGVIVLIGEIILLFLLLKERKK